MKRLVITGAIVCAAVAVTALLVTGITRAQGGLSISSYVIGGGGGPSYGYPYTLNATAGQPVVEVVTQSPYELCSGFWCAPILTRRVYLPIVLQSN